MNGKVKIEEISNWYNNKNNGKKIRIEEKFLNKLKKSVKIK